jgi:uncharacterized membrane protein YhfC
VFTTFLGIQLVLSLVVPIAIGLWLKRRLGLPWSLFFWGALVFLPAWLISYLTLALGELSWLFSSVIQMGTLYLIYRFQLKANTERQGLMAGAGLGGIEVLLIGLSSVLLLVQMLPLRDASEADLVQLAAELDGVSEEEVKAETVDDLREYIDDYWDTPWYGPLLQLLQALTLMPVQVALAVFVMGALIHDTLRPLFNAMVLHFLARLLPLYAGAIGGPIAWLGLSFLCGGIALWYLRQKAVAQCFT